MKKMNDEGFSLIELIIVITIMAILLMVLAPQYLKYVERSRNATDLENARSIVNALQIYAADTYINDTIPVHEETVTAFALDDPFSRDTRVDQYAVRALTAAGLMRDSEPVNIKTQSRVNWETWSVHYKSDGKGGITFRHDQTGTTPDGAFTFEERMLGK